MKPLECLISKQKDIATNHEETYEKVFQLKPPQSKGFNSTCRTQDEAVNLFIKNSLSGGAGLDELATTRRSNWSARDWCDNFSHEIKPEDLIEPCCTVLNKAVAGHHEKWTQEGISGLYTRRTASYLMGFWRISTFDYGEKGKIFHRDFSVGIETRNASLSFMPEVNEQGITDKFGREFYCLWRRKILDDLPSLRTCLNAARMSISDIHWSTTCSDRSLRLLKKAEVVCKGKNAFLVPAKYLPQPNCYCISNYLKEDMYKVE